MAFTEHGVAMLSSVLNNEQAVRVTIEIVRRFVRLRDRLASHRELAGKLEELEKTYDAQFKVVFEAVRQLMEAPPLAPRGRIGFRVEERPAYWAERRRRRDGSGEA